MSSPFGIRWTGGLLPEIHRGIDLQAAPGTPVGAMMKGTVRFAGWMTGFGNVVWLDHSGDVITIYAHLSEIRVAAGDPIEGGAILGLSGSSGNVTGPHLHFEVWKKGLPIDPARFLGL
jgi:murein DD-endopeptidase MepM/ murein hydrolase activator NlpD